MAKITRESSRKVKNLYLTIQGLERLQAELDILINIKRPEALDNIQKAREFGELPENSELQIAMDEQSEVEERIAYLEESLHKARTIKHTEGNEVVELGSTVRVKIDGKIDEYTIVGKLEANPLQKLISNESPVGSKLMGTKKGDEIEIITPTFKYRAKVLEIH